MEKDKFDAILVLGSGIRVDGSIPDSAKLRSEKAIELYRKGRADKIIFSGKWSYKATKKFPTTEAEAMAKYAESKGLEKDAIIIEKESGSTATNFCHIKPILVENNWTKVILVANRPYAERSVLNMKKILGPDYQTEVVLTEFRFPPEKEKQLEKTEKEKIKYVKNLFTQFIDGDDKAICFFAKEEEKILAKAELNK